MATSAIGNEDDGAPVDPSRPGDIESTEAARSFAESSTTEPGPEASTRGGTTAGTSPESEETPAESGETDLSADPDDGPLPKGN